MSVVCDGMEKFSPKFDQNGLLPAIAVDVKTGKVLMLAYMNRKSLQETLRSGFATYWSRSRSELWQKGATSGDMQDVQEIYVDCDQDAIVLKVEQKGDGACHTKNFSCFYRRLWSRNKNSKREKIIENLSLEAKAV